MLELLLFVIGALVLLGFIITGWTLDIKYEIKQPSLYFILGMVGAIIAMFCAIPFILMNKF